MLIFCCDDMREKFVSPLPNDSWNVLVNELAGKRVFLVKKVQFKPMQQIRTKLTFEAIILSVQTSSRAMKSPRQLSKVEKALR